MPTIYDSEQGVKANRDETENVTPVAIVTEPIAPDVPTSIKYAEILKSPRFHMLCAGFIVQTLRYYNYIDDYIANSITVFLASVIGIGTVDRFNQKPAPAAPGLTTRR